MKSYSDYNSANYTDIPMLQRDYVQGADVNAEKRDNFLDAIFESLLENDPVKGTMDFIYGSSHADGDDRKIFLPIDGQQRLTTLALIGWLLFQKVDKHEGVWEEKPDCLLPKMSYRTRHTTEQFFDHLMGYILPADYGNDIRKHLEDTPIWMAQRWKADPSINAMLDLLAAADRKLQLPKFKDQINEMALRFFDASPLQFEILDMEKYGLTEDLYIKMNARGKFLTPFENWKAEFTGMLEKSYGNVDYTFTKVGGQTYSIPEYFSHAIEHEWTDLLWPAAYRAWCNLSEEERKRSPYPRIDSQFMNILDFVSKALFYAQNPAGKEDGGDAKRFAGEKGELLNARRIDMYRPSVATEADTNQGRQNVETLFNILDTLCILFKGKDSAEFFAQLLYSGAWQPSSTNVNLFAKEPDVDLFAHCINGGLTPSTELLWFGILKYCINYSAILNADKLRNYIRVLWGWILTHKQRREAGKLSVDPNVRVAHYPALVEVANLLAADEDVYKSLAAIANAAPATPQERGKKLLDEELTRFSYREGFDTYFDCMMGCEDLKGYFTNLYPAVNAMIAMKKNPSEFFDRFEKFYNADSWHKASYLIEHGWKGIDDVRENNFFYGKKEHWDYVFAVEKNARCRANLQEAIKGYLANLPKNLPTPDKKEFYIRKYQSFFNAHRSWEGTSHLFSCFDDFTITMLLPSFSFYTPKYPQCPYAHTVVEQMSAGTEGQKDVIRKLGIEECNGSKDSIAEDHGYIQLNGQVDDSELNSGKYWLECTAAGWKFNFSKGTFTEWNDKWAERFPIGNDGSWTDTKQEFTFSTILDQEGNPTGAILLHDLPSPTSAATNGSHTADEQAEAHATDEQADVLLADEQAEAHATDEQADSLSVAAPDRIQTCISFLEALAAMLP